MSRDWIISAPWPQADEAALRWSVPALVAQLLFNRGIDLCGPAAGFLSPQLRDLIPPEQLPGAADAAALIVEAVRRREAIVLYGDYDVDGICGVAILWHILTLAGATVSYYVPHRLEEGYGLNPEAMRALIADGAKLIVSVDCGVTAVNEARIARDAGVPLVITDHHQPKHVLPDAAAIVHPNLDRILAGRDACGTLHDHTPDQSNPDLCGAGVAFKVGWMVCKLLSGGERAEPRLRDALMSLLPLAALGTVADVVPLCGENRVIARFGLGALKTSQLAGVRALIESAGLTGEKIDSYAVGFRLAPRLNAAGRMGHAREAVELLTTADENRAREIAVGLESQNRTRQSTERAITKTAREMVEARGMDRDSCRGIVLAAEQWHAGVIGIVAARLVDRYNRPTVLISLENGSGQGSARSVPHFHLHEALAACGEHLQTFGGHAMAAGLKIARERVGAFTDAFIARANQMLTGVDLAPKLRLEAEVPLAALDLRTAQAIANIGPFGSGNPRPQLATDWCTLAGEPRRVGKNGEHLQLSLAHNGAVLRAIAFRQASVDEQLKLHRRCRVAFEPSINTYNGRSSVELHVVDFQFPATAGF